jgi:glycosyltransferase involved in cell wall biosynthesis
MWHRDRVPVPQLREPCASGDIGGAGHIDAWCWSATCRAVERAVRRDRPLAVLAEYALLTKSFERVPRSVLKVIDTVEVFFTNPERFDIPGLAAPKVCSPASELLALARADVLIAIHRNDASQLSSLFPRARIITVPHAYPQYPRRPEGPDRGSVLYVGSSNPFNVHGLREFLAHAWPSILARAPSATLRVVGSVPAAICADADRVLHIGRVADAVLAREYQTAHVVVNPQIAGTGLKIKCVEALSAGCPLVVNRAGADGLEEGEGAAFLVSTTWPQFADHVVALLTNDQERLELEARARAFANRLFSSDAAFAQLQSALALNGTVA